MHWAGLVELIILAVIGGVFLVVGLAIVMGLRRRHVRRAHRAHAGAEPPGPAVPLAGPAVPPGMPPPAPPPPRVPVHGHAVPPPRYHPAKEQAPIEIWKLLLFVLIPPWAMIIMIIWLIECFVRLVEAICTLVELTVDLLGMLVTGVGAAIGDSPATRERLDYFSRELTEDGKKFLRIVAEPVLILAGYIGVGGLVQRVIDKWRGPEDWVEPGAMQPPVPADGAPACPFAGRYEISEKIAGGGSTAELFVVRRIEHDVPVGAKLLLKSFDLTRGAWLDSLVRESEGMRLAKRVGIVVDYMFGDDYFYYVMPYYEGPTLTRSAGAQFRTLQTTESLSDADLRRALGWVRDVLADVKAYHDTGLIHKDIKPENIILTAEGAKLVDVGLVTQLSSAMTLTTHGTEYFRDPELVRQAVAGTKVNEVDAQKFDLYSIGALLYFAVQGTFPATGPFSRYTRQVPYAVSAIANKAMSDFDKRYASADEMLADLDALLADGTLDGVRPAHLPSFRGAVAAADEASLAAPVTSVALSEAPAAAAGTSQLAGAPPVAAPAKQGFLRAVLQVMLIGVVVLATLAGVAFFILMSAPA